MNFLRYRPTVINFPVILRIIGLLLIIEAFF